MQRMEFTVTISKRKSGCPGEEFHSRGNHEIYHNFLASSISARACNPRELQVHCLLSSAQSSDFCHVWLESKELIFLLCRTPPRQLGQLLCEVSYCRSGHPISKKLFCQNNISTIKLFFLKIIDKKQQKRNGRRDRERLLITPPPFFFCSRSNVPLKSKN